MTMKTLSIIFAVALAASSVTGAPKVVTVKNPVTGDVSAVVKDNFIHCTGGPKGGPVGSVSEIQIAPAKLPMPDGPQYMLMITYGGSHWMFIGGELILNIDGKIARHKINPAFTQRNVESGAVVGESCGCLVTKKDIQAIAAGSKVLAQVSGQNGVLFLTFSPKNIAAFRDFLART
jgi:hypothetical protein